MDYFVRIEDPKSLRVAIMSAARDSLLMQTTLEELQAIRKDKVHMLNCAHEDFRQIINLCKRLSETIADDRVRKEVLDSVRVREDVHENQMIPKRELPAIKSVAREEPKTRLRRPLAKPSTLKPAPRNTLDMLPEIKEETLPVIAPPFKPQPSAQTKTEVDRLEYTLTQIEKKLADLQK